MESQENISEPTDAQFEDAISEEIPAPSEVIQKDPVIAAKLKNEANSLFAEGKNDEAQLKYDEALKYCPEGSHELYAIIFNNKGILYKRLAMKKEAKQYFALALEHNPTYSKALYHRLSIYSEDGDFIEAFEDAKKLREIDPSLIDPYQLSDLEAKSKQKQEQTKDEVLGHLKKFGNSLLGKFGMSFDNFKMAQNPDGTYNIGFNK